MDHVRLALLILLAVPVLGTAADPTLVVPSGFTIQKVAATPLVQRPVTATLDDRGRLLVADSSGSNQPVEKQKANPTHRIVRLEDRNGDGVFDHSTVFADKMMFLAGTCWHAGSLYVAAPPIIWKLTDTNDDGVADRREIWFDGGTLTGCANDLHGPYPGPDGYLYWTKGAFAEQQIPQADGTKRPSKAAHIWRARPDGSGREVVMTGGMDNPVELAFLPNGDLIFNTTFFQHPANGQRDGLVHAVRGALFGKDHAPVRDHWHSRPTLMPVLTHMGPAAPSGLHRYSSTAFGPEFSGNLFCTQFNLRKVSRHVLQPQGSTYRTIDSDFVTSEDPDFHPTDVL
ncbi:MAG: PVC-type heme-binding CxxCH protein, partial [Gemmataceae bacterium]